MSRPFLFRALVFACAALVPGCLTGALAEMPSPPVKPGFHGAGFYGAAPLTARLEGYLAKTAGRKAARPPVRMAADDDLLAQDPTPEAPESDLLGQSDDGGDLLSPSSNDSLLAPSGDEDLLSSESSPPSEDDLLGADVAPSGDDLLSGTDDGDLLLQLGGADSDLLSGDDDLLLNDDTAGETAEGRKKEEKPQTKVSANAEHEKLFLESKYTPPPTPARRVIRTSTSSGRPPSTPMRSFRPSTARPAARN
ncbi:hypothetical protein [Breoghania sp.]|uniref:hypothetical protein n=1 Tax=Breoghania sp. TaxID=2065378 RepID=UPI00262CA0A5|nr:hypothetical protein [Breoghania sp.]MDJ0932211.1 hypothetical protein [Breoghania sp.]